MLPYIFKQWDSEGGGGGGGVIPTRMCNHIHYRVWDENTYPLFRHVNGCAVIDCKWISDFMPYLQGMWLFIHAGIKVASC